LSAPVNVTASLSTDTSGGALKVAAVRSFIDVKQVNPPLAGETLGGAGAKPVPVKGFVTEVPQQVAESNGVTPLAVAAGQFVEVDVEFSPRASTSVQCQATLLINGDTWNPISIPITAEVGQVSVTVPSISVTQGTSTSVEITVTSAAGPATTASLIISATGSADSPNVTMSLSPPSVPVSQGKPGSSKLTVTADASLATGTYSWYLSVWSFDNTVSFSVPVDVKVTAPIVLGNLQLTWTPKELLRLQLNEWLINAADQATGKPLNGLQIIASAGFNGLNPITWPPIHGVTGTPFKYTPGINDSVASALVAGGPAYKDSLLNVAVVDPTPKVWAGNVEPASAVILGSGFLDPICNLTVDSEGFVHPGPYRGDITKGIRISISCDNPGQYWTIHVTSIAGGPTVTTNINCPNP